MKFTKGDLWEYKWGFHLENKVIMMLIEPDYHGYECLFKIIHDPDGLAEVLNLHNNMKAHIRSLIAEDHFGIHWRKLS